MSPGEVVDRAEAAVGRAGALLKIMLIKRRLNRPDLAEVISRLKEATRILEGI